MNAATNNANTPNTNAVAADAAVATTTKKIEAFFTRKDDKGPAVSLWISDKKVDAAPDFDGTIDNKRVVVRIRTSAKGGFMAINERVKTEELNADGKPVYKETQIGTANLVAISRGVPRLSIKLGEGDAKRDIWASVSKKVPEDMLVKAGLKLDLLAQKREAAEADRAAKAAAKPAETAVAQEAVAA